MAALDCLILRSGLLAASRRMAGMLWLAWFETAQARLLTMRTNYIVPLMNGLVIRSWPMLEPGP